MIGHGKSGVMRRKYTRSQIRALREAGDIASRTWQVSASDINWDADDFGAAAWGAGLAETDRKAAVNFLLVSKLLVWDSVPHRRAGRPGWTDELFRRRLDEAIEATAPPRTAENVSANFRRLDNTIGVDPASLRRLCRERGLILPGPE